MRHVDLLLTGNGLQNVRTQPTLQVDVNSPRRVLTCNDRYSEGVYYAECEEKSGRWTKEEKYPGG